MTSKSVFADHIDMVDVQGYALRKIEDALFAIAILIQSTVVVTFPAKLAGGTLPGLGAVWILCAIMCFGLALMNPLQTIKAAIRGWPFVLLLLWAGLSITWTAQPYETGRGLLLLYGSQVLAFAVAGRFSWQRIIEITAWTLCGITAVSILIAIGMPHIGQMQGNHQGAWSGAFAEKQGLGFHACFALLAALAMTMMGPKFRLWWLAVIMCVVAIIGSTGKTAVMMLALSLALFFWFRIFYRGLFGKVTGSWIVAVAAIIIVPAATGAFEYALKLMGRTSDLTGRTEVWDAVQKVADMRPEQGWGYQAIFRGVEEMTSPYQWISEWSDFLPANAHSSWLDIYAQLGRPGVALLALSMVWVWASFLIKSKVPNVALAFTGATLAAITFASFTETNLMTAMEFQWMFVTLLGCKMYMSAEGEGMAEPKAVEADDPPSGELNGDIYTY